MSGGPFRDTLTPLIDDAQRQLAEMRQQRAALEARYEAARARLDEKTQPPAIELFSPREPVPASLPPDTFRTVFLVGLILGLITWLPIFVRPR